MKKIENYFKDVELNIDYLNAYNVIIDRNILLNIIKQIQTDTIKETVQYCADNLEASVSFIRWPEENKEEYNFQAGQDYEVYVIKSSTLECADKLIKEL